MMEVKLRLGRDGSSLAIDMLYHADSTERKETFERIKVEVRVLLAEQDVGSRRWGEVRLGGQVDAIGYILLEIDNELRREDIFQGLENSDGFFIYLLDVALGFMAVGVWCCMGNRSVE